MPVREVNDKWVEVAQDVSTASRGTRLLQLRKWGDPSVTKEMVLISDPWEKERQEILLFPLDLLIEGLQALKAVDNGEG